MMRILLSGGGTLGSVTPLLAVVEELRKKESMKFLWIGTLDGPERPLVLEAGIPFRSIMSGKLRRYFSFWNFIDPLIVLFSFFYSFLLLFRFWPHVVLSVGGFVSVPLVWAAWCLRIPVFIHQQDVRVGLANKLMAPFAKKIFVTFEESLSSFPRRKTVLAGTAVREIIQQYARAPQRKEAQKFFSITDDVPTVLVLGGGTGAMALNEIVWKALPELTQFFHIIHLTGKGKSSLYYSPLYERRYHAYEFLTKDMPLAYVAADVIVTRAGMGVLSECAALAKPLIVVPLPGTHQEENAAFLAKHGAAIVREQDELTPVELSTTIRLLIEDKSAMKKLGEKIHTVIPTNAVERIVRDIEEL